MFELLQNERYQAFALICTHWLICTHYAIACTLKTVADHPALNTSDSILGVSLFSSLERFLGVSPLLHLNWQRERSVTLSDLWPRTATCPSSGGNPLISIGRWRSPNGDATNTPPLRKKLLREKMWHVRLAAESSPLCSAQCRGRVRCRDCGYS